MQFDFFFATDVLSLRRTHTSVPPNKNVGMLKLQTAEENSSPPINSNNELLHYTEELVRFGEHHRASSVPLHRLLFWNMVAATINMDQSAIYLLWKHSLFKTQPATVEMRRVLNDTTAVILSQVPAGGVSHTWLSTRSMRWWTVFSDIFWR